MIGIKKQGVKNSFILKSHILKKKVQFQGSKTTKFKKITKDTDKFSESQNLHSG